MYNCCSPWRKELGITNIWENSTPQFIHSSHASCLLLSLLSRKIKFSFLLFRLLSQVGFYLLFSESSPSSQLLNHNFYKLIMVSYDTGFSSGMLLESYFFLSRAYSFIFKLRMISSSLSWWNWLTNILMYFYFRSLENNWKIKPSLKYEWIQKGQIEVRNMILQKWWPKRSK